MQISKKSDYALRSMIYVAAWNNEKNCSINEIAAAENIPRGYLAKILRELLLQGLLQSFKGINGGYKLAKSRKDITFLNVVESMQGKIAVNGCIRHSKENYCRGKNRCAMHSFWNDEQDRVIKALGSVNLASFNYGKFYTFAKKNIVKRRK
jgi:Rrf2 family protein